MFKHPTCKGYRCANYYLKKNTTKSEKTYLLNVNNYTFVAPENAVSPHTLYQMDMFS